MYIEGAIHLTRCSEAPLTIHENGIKDSPVDEKL